MIKNIFRIQAYDSIKCAYFCIGFIDFIFRGKTLTDFTIVFSSHHFKKNDKVVLNFFLKQNISMRETHVCDAAFFN